MNANQTSVSIHWKNKILELTLPFSDLLCSSNSSPQWHIKHVLESIKNTNSEVFNWTQFIMQLAIEGR